MADEKRLGYYQDKEGGWHKERRSGRDRRRANLEFPHRDRRTMGRRKADKEFEERDAQQQIEEALEDFAAEHDNHS